MTSRKNKFPDTEAFHYFNANPKGKLTGDCSFRAISMALGMDYNESVRERFEMFIETGIAPDTTGGEEDYLKSKGWVKNKQPRKIDGTKYTGVEFVEEFKGTCVAHIGGHHTVCIKDGKIWDTWDSSHGCIGNYWTKGEDNDKYQNSCDL